MLSDNCGMWIRDEVAHICGMPVIPPRQSAGPIHSLLHYGPLASRTHDKAVQIELKSVRNRIVIDSCRKPAGARQSVAIKTPERANCAKFIGCFARMVSTAAANTNSQFVG